MKFEFTSTEDGLPPYGAPVLIKSNGVVQHVTYMRDGSDDQPDWFEPYHFEHEDCQKIPAEKVNGWIALPDWYE